jgi:hypothetical protein
MPELPDVIHAAYVDGYRLDLEFSEGRRGIVDFEPWLDGPVFEPLRDIQYFRRYFLEGGTVAWPNGADIAPETLHAKIEAEEAA